MKSEEKFEALAVLYPDLCLQRRCGKWVCQSPKMRTRNGMPEDRERWGTGETAEDAIDNLWFWLTADGPDSGRIVGPAGQNDLIVAKGKEEVWFRWDRFMWKEVLRQPL